MIKRRQSRLIHVGSVPVGGGSPVTVQSMTTTKTADVDGTLAQVYALAAAGADIVRITCNDVAAAQGLAEIVPRSPVPIIADIHFQYKLALAALEAGVHALRLNPGNIRNDKADFVFIDFDEIIIVSTDFTGAAIKCRKFKRRTDWII